ncbi:hypothetical protein N474_16295 [Pseudoalteromonas luteoviolacea CPMOR-2]|uniref:Uncharacterized protein n=1 Tax=Pseudoalteromonas luteoviolacea DSM 6061 TaxID=1365250 RepID=A0A166VU18_9GAMM|nr:hypothetical protein N475_19655 [Pseudoalteromonas luteoviolacea DSM 6061]KZN55030.1 hypothetical protein N474_16295 [Pseudoalteromonas luteoviolacea CPMOR-2]MBE0389224.1 hypothetical protein [Pseudoalteromonas luteoviolacea DSM 6061]
MEKIIAIATFFFGILFVAAGIFLFVMGVKEQKLEPKVFSSWCKTILVISICLFAAYNTLISGYLKMINTGLLN